MADRRGAQNVYLLSSKWMQPKHEGAKVMETQSHIPVEKASLDEVATTVVMARVTDYFGFFA